MYGTSYLPGVPPGMPPVFGISTSIPALPGIPQNIPTLPGIPQDTPIFPGVPQNPFPTSSYYGGPSGSNGELQVPGLQQQMAGLAVTETSGKLIAALKKLYTDDQKFKAERYEMLNYKLRQKNQEQRLQIVHNDAKYVQQRARGAYIAAICQPEASYDLSAAAQCRQPTKEKTAKLNSRIE
jgi:hypothetical protein